MLAVNKKNLLHYFAGKKRTDLSSTDAAAIVTACKNTVAHHKVDEALDLASKLLGGFGVEPINGKYVDNYYQNIVGLYVNMGDSYDATILFDTVKEKFYVTSWGDFVESKSRAYGIE